MENSGLILKRPHTSYIKNDLDDRVGKTATKFFRKTRLLSFATAANPLSAHTSTINIPLSPTNAVSRPLVPSALNRRRTAAGRRRPTVRDIPRGGPVVLALGYSGLVNHRRSLTSANLRGVIGPATGGVGRKRPHTTGNGDTDDERSHKAPLPRPPGAGRQDQVDNLWLALRRTLHQRYQEFQENGVAEEAAAESSWRAGAGRTSGGGCGGELLSPGLR